METAFIFFGKLASVRKVITYSLYKNVFQLNEGSELLEYSSKIVKLCKILYTLSLKMNILKIKFIVLSSRNFVVANFNVIITNKTSIFASFFIFIAFKKGDSCQILI